MKIGDKFLIFYPKFTHYLRHTQYPWGAPHGKPDGFLYKRQLCEFLAVEDKIAAEIFLAHHGVFGKLL